MRPGEQVPSSARLQDFNENKIGGVRRRAPSLVVAVFESGYPTTGAFPCFTPTDLTWGLQGPRWAALPPGAAAIYCGGSSGAGAIGSEARAPLPTAFGVHNIPVFGAPYLSQPVTASATGVVAPSLTRLTGNVQAAVAQMSEPVTAAVAADGATAALAGVAVVGGGLKWGRTSAATWRSIPSRWRGAVNANVPFLLQMPKFACRITPVCLAGLQREPCSP